MQCFTSLPSDDFSTPQIAICSECASPSARVLQTCKRSNDTQQVAPICANTSSSTLHINEVACSDAARNEKMPDEVAYETLRMVVYILISTNIIQCDTKQKQLEALANEGLQPEKALVKFVRNGGLISLNELITTWNNSEGSTDRVLFLLKILSMLPGISAHAISASKIGRKLKRVTTQQLHPSELKELAEWIIAKWKVDILPASDHKSKSTDFEKSFDDYIVSIADAKSSSRNSANCLAPKYLQKTKMPGIEKSIAKATSSSRPKKRKVDILDIALNSSKYRKSNPNLHQGHRRSKLIQTLKDRQKSIRDVGDILSTIIVDWKAAKVRFGDSTIVDFDNSEEVSEMMNSRKYGGRVKASAGILKPAKSILKVISSLQGQKQPFRTSLGHENSGYQPNVSREAHSTSNIAAGVKFTDETDVLNQSPRLKRPQYQSVVCAESPSLRSMKK